MNPELALIGSWRLRAWTLRDGRGVTHPFGSDARGLLIYAADGAMSAIVSADARPVLPGTRPRDASPPQLAEAYLSFFTYAGRWRVEGDVVLHDVELALNPNSEGTVQRRQLTFTGTTRLDLSAVEPSAHGERVHTLSWERD